MAQLIRGIYNLKPFASGCVVTIGNFDGIHVGHQALLEKVKEKACSLGLPSVVVTFEPLPKEFFQQNNKIPRLTRWREKYDLLSRFGVDYIFVINFNKKFAQMRADDFVNNILYQGLNAQHVIVGDDFRFGFERQGSFTFLQNAGLRYGMTVEDMPSVLINHERVSSTLVREALIRGDHNLAERLLGRPYSMQGRVVHGDARGRIIGFPTANIYLHRKVTPVKGVYVVRMYGIAQAGLPGVANVGTRPTVDGTRSLLEVHLFNFNQEIYSRYVSVEFCEKLRDEKRFDNIELLKQQIWKDAEVARHYFIARREMQ
jgi:riboflavin kinase/FMN adenylyltransferase